MSNYVSASAGADNTVLYTDADERVFQYTGGDRNWRNQNPGNVRSNSIQWDGKIGSAGGFCIFSNPEFGRRAVRKILSNRRKENKTLSEAISSYAPQSENNTNAYLKDVERRTGISGKTRLSDLNDSQMESIAQAIFIHEGTREGTVHQLKPKKNPPTGFYIWHTSHDEKVRDSHAERDGKLFDFGNPPAGGNPGDDYNCRCWAEPLSSLPNTPKTLNSIFKK